MSGAHSSGWWLEWVRSLTDAELEDYRWLLFDVAEAVERGSDLHEFAGAAMKVVNALQTERACRRNLEHIGTEEFPGLDGADFAEAFLELTRASHRLGLGLDLDELVDGALEVAENRAQNGERDG